MNHIALLLVRITLLGLVISAAFEECKGCFVSSDFFAIGFGASLLWLAITSVRVEECLGGLEFSLVMVDLLSVRLVCFVICSVCLF